MAFELDGDNEALTVLVAPAQSILAGGESRLYLIHIGGDQSAGILLASWSVSEQVEKNPVLPFGMVWI